MTATVEPGRAEDWEDTGPIPLYTRTGGDTAKWRDRGQIIANLIAERDEARAWRDECERQFQQQVEARGSAEAEVRDLRAKMAAVEEILASDHYPELMVDLIEQALVSVGRTEPAPEADETPLGLTISEDGALLNWQGENYVRQSPSCDSCGCQGFALRYSPEHGANFCDGCYEHENPDAPDAFTRYSGTAGSKVDVALGGDE